MTRLVRGVLVAALLVVPLAPVARADGAEDRVAAALFNKINNKRAKAQSLNRLESWAAIVKEATDHAGEQARTGDVGHSGFEGRASRIRAGGSGISGICENVGTVSGESDKRAVIRILYRGWDKSAEHHACLFDEDFKTTWAGVGVKRVGSDTWYATFIAAQDSSPSQP